jgi:hypothetical protein
MSDYFKSENLANALNRARTTAIRGIVESGSLTRQDREILQRTGHISPIMRGWYHFSNDPHPRDTRISPEDFFRFLAIYLDTRLGEKWCFSAETSLELLLFPEKIPPRMVVTAMYSSTTVKTFPQITKLTIYEDAEAYHPGYEQKQGLRLLPLEMALSRLPRKIWHHNPDLIAAALKSLTSTEDITWRLLQEGRQQAAGRLAGALHQAGRIGEGNDVIKRMTQAGYPMTTKIIPDDKTRENHHDPLNKVEAPTLIKQNQNLTSLWLQWQSSLSHLMMISPDNKPPLLQHLATLQNLHVEDTIHSLQLSGFQPTAELILDTLATPEKNAESRGWPLLEESEKILSASHSQPLAGSTDPMTSLACQGYVDAFKAVKRSIVRLLENEEKGKVIGEDISTWLKALVEPTTMGGFFPPETLTSYRQGKPAGHLSHEFCQPEAIPDELERLKEHLQSYDSGIYLATMANLAIHWISPWRTGTGRLARFLMNTLLAGNGNDWSIISGTLQDVYGRAIEDGIRSGNAGPMAILISNGSIRTPR